MTALVQTANFVNLKLVSNFKNMGTAMHTLTIQKHKDETITVLYQTEGLSHF